MQVIFIFWMQVTEPLSQCAYTVRTFAGHSIKYDFIQIVQVRFLANLFPPYEHAGGSGRY